MREGGAGSVMAGGEGEGSLYVMFDETRRK